MVNRKALIAVFALFLVASLPNASLARQLSDSKSDKNELDIIHSAALAKATIDEAALGRNLLSRYEQENEDDEGDDEDDTECDDEDDGCTTGGGGTTTSSLPPAAGPCVVQIKGVSKTYTRCYSFGSGTVYYTLSGSTLSVAYKIKTAGWSALAIGSPHAGASTVFTKPCGAKCVRPKAIVHSGFNPGSWRGPTPIKFTTISGVKNALGEHVVSFTMPWTGASTTMTLTNGAGTSGQHSSIPKKYTVMTTDLQ